MRRPERIPAILGIVADLWAQSPDMRLGQLLLNISHDQDLFNVEDWDLATLMVEELKMRDDAARAKAFHEFTNRVHSKVPE